MLTPTEGIGEENEIPNRWYFRETASKQFRTLSEELMITKFYLETAKTMQSMRECLKL